jgi:hypothetical protein
MCASANEKESRERKMDEYKSEFSIWVNPLMLPSLDERLPKSKDNNIDFSRLIADLGSPNVITSIKDIQKRYKRLTKHDNVLFLIPIHPVILHKLVWPLKAAKQAFCMGNFLGCIALCGTVTEMATIFLFELAKPQVNGQEMDAKTQENLLGGSFEKLRQERRVKVLKAYGILNLELAEIANQIRGIRKRYLHILSQDFDNIERDAEMSYEYAARFINEIVGLKTINDGVITISPLLAKYMAGARQKSDEPKNIGQEV